MSICLSTDIIPLSWIPFLHSSAVVSLAKLNICVLSTSWDQPVSLVPHEYACHTWICILCCHILLNICVPSHAVFCFWIFVSYVSPSVLGPICVPVEYACHNCPIPRCLLLLAICVPCTSRSPRTNGRPRSLLSMRVTPPPPLDTGAKPLFVKGCRSDQGEDSR